MNFRKRKKNIDNRDSAVLSEQTMNSSEATEKNEDKPKTKKIKRNRKQKKSRESSFLGNMKIAPKLLLGFLIIALLAAALGGFALINMMKISDMANAMYAEVLSPVKLISSLSDLFNASSIHLRQGLLSEDKDLVAHTSQMETDTMKYTSTLALLADLIPDDSKDKYNEMKNAYENYTSLFKDAINKMKSGNRDEVLNDVMHFGELRTAEGQVGNLINELKFILTEDSAKQNTEMKNSTSSSMYITIASAVFVIILSVLIGVLIARGFSRPIKRLTQHVQKLALGDTDISLTVYPRKDEIGLMREAIGTITKSIKELESDTSLLIEAAKEGELSVRADAQKHQGIYREIVDGFNETLDAMIGPIKESTTVLAGLAQGDLNISVTGEFMGDYALIKDALNSTVETVKHYIDEVSDILEHIARGDMTVSIYNEYKGGFARLKESINKSIVAFNDVLSEIDTAATQVASGSRQVSNGSQTISQGATEQAAEIDQLTATVTEIAAQAGQNAKNADNANELVKTAKADASKGTSQMDKMQKSMEEIKTASMSIGKIIKVIDDIAFQTNILALNAAVEAARAGTHGKGFAVVADEVRSLAARSAQAAKETTELIENSIAIVGSGTKIADETAGALQNIVSGVDKAADLVAQIAVASSEQVIGINQINNSIDQMMRVVQTNSATSEETAAASEELSSQSEMLREMVAGFQLRGKSETALKYEESVKAIESGTAKEKIVLRDDEFGKY